MNLHQDDAVVGEAAGIAMGLVMMGSNQASAIEEMCQYAAGKSMTRHDFSWSTAQPDSNPAYSSHISIWNTIPL